MVKSLLVGWMLAFLLGGCSGSGSSSQPATLVTITVTPASAAVSPGTTRQFSASGHFSDGSVTDLTGKVIWKSSAPFAIIDTQGLATAVSTGTSSITATSGAVVSAPAATLTVAAVQSISVAPILNPSNLLILEGTSTQFKATGTLSDQLGTSQDLTANAVWETSNHSVATVSSAGVVTAGVTGGTVDVTATFGSLVGRATLTVLTVNSLTLAPLNPTIDVGAGQQFLATGNLTNATTRDVTSQVGWSSDNPAVVAINGASGLATAVSPGSTTIRASFQGVTQSTPVTVLGPSFITVTPASVSLVAGTTQQFNALGNFVDGSTHDLTNLVAWSSSAPGVASLSNASGSKGLATALATSPTPVTVTATLGVAGTASLSVKTLQSFAITPANPSVKLGSVTQLAAVGTFSDASTQDITGLVTWSSAQPAIASVSNTAGSKGLVTGRALGSTTINGAISGFTGSATVAVVSSTVTPASRAFVVDFGSNNLSVVDNVLNTVSLNLQVGSGPQGVAVSPSTNRIYVANSGSNTLSVIDIANNALIDTVNVGSGPYDVAVNATARKVYVTNSLSGTLSVIDTTNDADTVVATIPVGTSPKGVAVNSATNRVYVANSGSGSLSVINGTTNTVLATATVRQAPLGVAVNLAGTRVYVANNNVGIISVIDTVSNSEIAAVNVGSGPWGVALNDAGSRLYVTNNTAGTLSVIDTSNNTVAATVPVGSAPRGVMVSPTSNLIYVANFGSNTISVIEPAANSVTATTAGLIAPADVAVIP